MKIGICSDLHSEFWKASDLSLMQTKLRTALAGSDIILLAGDIDYGFRAVSTAHGLFPELPVYLIAGNHEFYGFDYGSVRDGMKSKDNVHVLQQSSVILSAGDVPVRLLATTLWTDFNLLRDPEIAMFHARRSLNDYRLIKHNEHELRPQDTLDWHNTERAWLLDQVRQPFAGKTIVMTHHAPTSRAVCDPYINDILSPSFASRIEEDLIRYNVDLVVWGHTHQSVDHQIDGTRFLSNQTGYIRGNRSETGDYGKVIDF